MSSDKKLLRRSFIKLIERIGRPLTAQELVEVGARSRRGRDARGAELEGGR
jgi:hypothetical protein